MVNKYIKDIFYINYFYKEEYSMPKLKTNKAAKKRYSYTATGKVKRTKSNMVSLCGLGFSTGSGTTR